MFNLGRLRHLAAALGVPLGFLHEVLDDFEMDRDSLVSELRVWPIENEKKARDVICLKKRWSLIQERIYLKLLLPKFVPSRASHGGVRRRGPVTNARAHLGNTFAFVTDISNFFPSIDCDWVNTLFLDQACSYEVARALTRLCTYEFHLALGLTSSPIIANELMRPVDRDITRACKPRGFTFTRFMDDITISAPYRIKESGIADIVKDILQRHGLRLAAAKTRFGRLDRVKGEAKLPKESEDKQLAITGVELKGEHLNPSKTFIAKLQRIIQDHASLAADGPFVGPLYTHSQVFGRAYHAFYLNSGLKRNILGQLKSIDWCEVMNNAVLRELCMYRSRTTKRDAPRPDLAVELPLSVGRRYARRFAAEHPCDPNDAPFEADAISGPGKAVWNR